MKDSRLYGKFTLDFADNYKIMPLSDAAFRCLVEATLWSRAQMSDGLLARRYAVAKWGLDVLTELATNDPDKPSLIESEEGWLIRDFAEHQDTKAEIEARSKRNKAAGQRGGIARAKRVAKRSASESISEIQAETETETETRGNPPNAAASSYVPREEKTQQRHTTFSDGTPIGEDPGGPDVESQPSLALVPSEIGTSARPSPVVATGSAQSLVRYACGTAGVPKAVQKSLSEEVTKLANDRNVTREDIDAALAEWINRPGAGPRLLPNLVADAARKRRSAPTTGVGNPTKKAMSIQAAGEELIRQMKGTS